MSALIEFLAVVLSVDGKSTREIAEIKR